MLRLLLLATSFIVFFTLSTTRLSAQNYRTSITSTDIDFITKSDPSQFARIEFRKKGLQEMPDKRPGNNKLRHEAYSFVASFKDNTAVTINLAASFGSEEAALQEVKRYVDPLGKLPTELRKGVRRLVIHNGGDDTTAFSDEGLIVVYSGNAMKRIAAHDLEETIFHESVHAAWDKRHANSKAWIRAQRADGTFVTSYAQSKPKREDLAESALFAYTLLHHPDRIPKVDAKKIRRAIPNRIQFIADLMPPDTPVFYDVKTRRSLVE